jgi:iron complex transport system substrate-binding protein
MRRFGSISGGAVTVFLALMFGEPTCGQTPVRAAPKPMHIMSVDECTDLLLLQMVPKARIASVTFLAHDGVNALFPGADAGVPTNHGTSEDVINQRPDLILAGDFATPMTRKLAKQIGIPIVDVKSANDFDDVRTAVRQVGTAVGEPQRAENIIRQMDATLTDLARTKPKHPLRVVSWSGGNYVAGKETLTNAIIQAAGALNIAAQPGASDSTFDVEQLLEAQPDALLYGGDRAGKPSLHSDEAQHPLVRRLYGDRRIAVNDTAYACGLPQSADAARDLRAALLSLPPRKPWR